jgi:hypothetical protein
MDADWRENKKEKMFLRYYNSTSHPWMDATKIIYFTNLHLFVESMKYLDILIHSQNPSF